jgi:ABC-type lipoprotein export system ATPase subunit
VAIVGRSGSGKSTLLNLAAGIDVPTSGRVSITGRAMQTMSERERTRIRRDHIGLVFQFFHLLPHLTVHENVLLPSLIAGDSRGHARENATALLRRVGLADRSDSPLEQLSGGEMQRVAICRALMRNPTLLLADEPTGNLDDETGQIVMDLLLELAREQQHSMIYVTHSSEFAKLADEIWSLHSGQLEVG